MKCRSRNAVVPAQVITGAEHIQSHLNGYEEVPSISTFATGDFRGMISPQDDAIDWELSYSGLQGDVTQAHIHFGQSGANGGVIDPAEARNAPDTACPAKYQNPAGKGPVPPLARPGACPVR